MLELTRYPEEHLPEDLLFACELIVERPPRHAGGPRQLVHAHRAEATFKEEALGSLDDGLARPATPGLREGFARTIVKFHVKPLALISAD